MSGNTANKTRCQVSVSSASSVRLSYPSLVLGVLLSCAASSPIIAAEEPELEVQPSSSASTTPQQARGGLEEVTVTARKTTENLQDTPVAISALSGEALANSGINNVSDLSKAVPSLEIANKGGSNASPYVRGVGQRQNKATLDPAVAIYMDDIYLGRPDGALMDLADVANLQVLRGPQGTLFGRNATGGAIVISPKKPTDVIEGMFLARTGSFNRQDVQFAINTPITDNFYSRLALGQTKRDGYSTNIATGNDQIDNQDRKFVLAQARWFPMDYTTVDFAINYSKQDEFSRSNHCQLAPRFAGGQNVFQLPPLSLIGAAYGQDYRDACEVNQRLADNEDYDRFSSSLDPTYKTDAKGASLVISHEFETFDLKSVTSWRQVDVEQTQDVDGVNVPLVDQQNLGNPHETSQFTQEFQISGYLLEGDLDYTAGVYYWTEENENGIEVTETGPLTLGNTGLPLFSIYRRDYLERKTDNESYAAFGQMTYHLTDYFDVTAGLRYTKETRELESTRIDNRPRDGVSLWADDVLTPLVSGGSGGTPVGGLVNTALNLFGGAFLQNPILGNNIRDLVATLEGAYVYVPYNPLSWNDPSSWVVTPEEQLANGLDPRVVDDESSFDAWTPMLNFTYFFPDKWLDALDADSGMMYFTWSKGFRAGGLVTQNTQYDTMTGEHFGDISKYDPERVTNYEIGTKLDLFGNLRLNAAMFYMDYTDQQATLVNQNILNPLQVQAQLDNIGESTIYGAELEITYLPTENIDLTLNINYTEAEYEKFTTPYYPSCSPPFSGDVNNPTDPNTCGFFNQQTIIDRTDEEMPYVTPLKVYFAAQYRQLTPWFMLTPRVEAIYKSGYDTHLDRGSWNTGLWEQRDFVIYNARLNVDFYNEQTRLAFAVNNISDKRPIDGGFPLVDTFGGGTVTYGPPRTWTAELIHRF